MRRLTKILTVCLMATFCSTAMATTYSALTSMETQVAKTSNTPAAITLAGTSTAAFKVEGSKITIKRAGDYYLSAAAQVGGAAAGNIYLWLRVNGKDLADSNSVQNIPSKDFTAVLVSQGGMTFKAGDVFELVYAASAPGLGLVASTPAGMPAVPSIIFAIFEL